MQALARFSEATYSSELNKLITFNVQGLSADPVTITDKTRFERTEYEVIKSVHVATILMLLGLTTSISRFQMYQAT